MVVLVGGLVEARATKSGGHPRGCLRRWSARSSRGRRLARIERRARIRIFGARHARLRPPESVQSWSRLLRHEMKVKVRRAHEWNARRSAAPRSIGTKRTHT